MEELVELAKRAVNIALKMGAEEAEAYLAKSRATSIEIERGQIVRSTMNIDQGIGVRAICEKAVGFSYTNILSGKAIEETANKAYRAAKASKPDTNWVKLPAKKDLASPKGTFDKKIVDLSSDTLVERASELLEAVSSYDKRVLAVDGGVSASQFSNIVVNSNDIEASDNGTAVACSMDTIARDGSDVTPACFELDAKRVYDINPSDVGIEAARQAISSLKAKKIGSGALSVIFNQAAFQSLLYYTVINAVKADFVQRERSAFKDMIGESVASNLVSIDDDGLLEGGLLTSKFDGEGVPSQKTKVIEEGVLKNFLYDNYTANKVGEDSTGNASRSDSASYASTPVLEASNFVFKAGNMTSDELIEDVKDGLLVFGVQGAHSSNPESGEFSVVATPAWKIEKGEIAYPVRDVMITGTFFDVLKNISAVGNNIRQLGQLVSPWLLTDKIKTVGRE